MASAPCFAVDIHYDDVIMDWIASQITSLPVVCSIVYSDVNQRKHQSSASLAFVREIHRGPVNFPHKWPVTRKMFPFDDVIMKTHFAFLCFRQTRVPFTIAWTKWTRSEQKGHCCANHCHTFNMMTSSNGNIFRVTVPLWGESTGHRWILLTKASDAELWCFFDLRLNKRLSKQSRHRWLGTPSRSLWHHSNVIHLRKVKRFVIWFKFNINLFWRVQLTIRHDLLGWRFGSKHLIKFR